MQTSHTLSLRPDYTPHARAERLIASGRFVLALSSLTAVYLEPSTPAQHQQATYTLLAVYTLYSLLAGVYAWRSPVPSANARLMSHLSDLALFSVFVYLTEGPASPFFLYFVFSLFCATLRFHWRGILATGIAAMAVYGAMALVASWTDPSFDESRTFIRIAYLSVITALLVYLGLYQQQLRNELAALAAWPRELASERDDVLLNALRHAAQVLHSERVLFLWEESEEPWLQEASFGPEGFSAARLAPGQVEMPVAPRNSSVLARSDDELLLVYDAATRTVREEQQGTLSESFRSRHRLDSAIVVSMESETLSAWFVVPGKRVATADDLALAHVVGRLVLAALEQFFFVQQVRQTAGTEERLRISRDLHDGIVQSLAGVGIILRSLRDTFAGDSGAVEQLDHVSDALERDQRELRTIVRELRLHDSRKGGEVFRDELERMRERFPLEWGLEVVLDEGNAIDVTASVAHELTRIVNESLSNAARHGGASRVLVSAANATGSVKLRIRDNGKGFPFTGRYDLVQLDGHGYGPRTLKERVRSLGGELFVESSAGGATIEIDVPCREAR